MNKLLQETLPSIHFVGIGGIGMSGIAEVLHNMGYKISGSDLQENAIIKRLRGLGIEIQIGHHPRAVHGKDCVVVSSAVSSQNVELCEARTLKIPVVQRAEMLAELMRLKSSVAVAGTHGKTTTTSLVAALFEGAGLEPTVVNGGILNACGTNAYLGKGEWIIVEADESDGSFTKLSPTIAVVTNIDPEHMEFYKTTETLEKAFETFVSQIPFYGFAVLCVDHPTVKKLATSFCDRRVLTYGFAEEALVRATNLRLTPQGTIFDVEVRHFEGEETANVSALPRVLKELFLPMVGEHNVQNALAAIAMAYQLGFGEETVRQALQSFKGVKRRFTYVGTSHDVTIIDDYAHHPVEIQTVIKAARQAATGRVLVVFQPHRYSRLSSLWEDFTTCFSGADGVIMAPIYSAGEDAIEGITTEKLAGEVRLKTKQLVWELKESTELPYLIRQVARPGDLVVCMGAGSITYWAATLPSQLDQLLAEAPGFALEESEEAKEARG